MLAVYDLLLVATVALTVISLIVYWPLVPFLGVAALLAWAARITYLGPLAKEHAIARSPTVPFAGEGFYQDAEQPDRVPLRAAKSDRPVAWRRLTSATLAVVAAFMAFSFTSAPFYTGYNATEQFNKCTRDIATCVSFCTETGASAFHRAGGWLWHATHNPAVPLTCYPALETQPPIESTETSEDAETTSSSAVSRPQIGSVVGEACTNPGQIGLTTDGTALLCSESALDGSLLSSPKWRLPASEDVQVSEERERSAVALAREVAPILNEQGDGAVLLGLNEYAAALRLAIERNTSPEETFSSLATGWAAQNDATLEDGALFTLAMLAGVEALLPHDDPAQAYATATIDWFAETFGD